MIFYPSVTVDLSNREVVVFTGTISSDARMLEFSNVKKDYKAIYF